VPDAQREGVTTPATGIAERTYLMFFRGGNSSGRSWSIAASIKSSDIRAEIGLAGRANPHSHLRLGGGQFLLELVDAGLQLLDRGPRPAALAANFLCHPRQGSGRIDVATELGDDGSDPRLVVAIHCLAE
jgi:hypothetical protein